MGREVNASSPLFRQPECLASVCFRLSGPDKCAALPPSIEKPLEIPCRVWHPRKPCFFHDLWGILPGEGVCDHIVVRPQVCRVEEGPMTSFNGCQGLEKEAGHWMLRLPLAEPGDDDLVVSEIQHNLPPISGAGGWPAGPQPEVR